MILNLDLKHEVVVSLKIGCPFNFHFNEQEPKGKFFDYFFYKVAFWVLQGHVGPTQECPPQWKKGILNVANL